MFEVLYNFVYVAAIAAAIGLLILYIIKTPISETWPVLALGAIILALIATITWLPLWLSTWSLILLIIAIVIINIWFPFIPLFLAQYNLFWTVLREGQAKLVEHMGKYHKTLLAKEGHKVDEDGEIVTLGPGEPEQSKSGLRWVGIWPFYMIKWMKFNYIKSLTKPDKEGKLYDIREDEWRDWIFADVKYPYALLLKNAEDSHMLPLDVQSTGTGSISNPRKAVYTVSDWYDFFVSRTLPKKREYISNHSYEAMTHDPDQRLDVMLFKDLSTEKVDKIGTRERTMIEILHEDAGFKLHALEVVNIDPGAEHRQLTIQKLIGQRNAEQAVQETAGRILESVAISAGITVDELKAKLAADEKLKGKPEAEGGFKEAFAHARDLINRDRVALGGVTDIRVGATNGKPLKDAGVASFLAGIGAWGQSFKPPRGGGRPRSGRGSSNPSEAESPDDSDTMSYEQSAEAFFKQHGKYPKWDPKKRTPN